MVKLASIPGRSSSCGSGNSTRSVSRWVVGSTDDPKRAIWPSKVRPGWAINVARARCPGRNIALSVSVTLANIHLLLRSATE